MSDATYSTASFAAPSSNVMGVTERRLTIGLLSLFPVIPMPIAGGTPITLSVMALLFGIVFIFRHKTTFCSFF